MSVVVSARSLPGLCQVSARVLHRHSHSASADLNSNSVANEDANENDSCYYLGPGEGY